MALTHKGSKRFLGRQYTMQVRCTCQPRECLANCPQIMLDVLLTSRHVPWGAPSKDNDKTPSSSSNGDGGTLASVNPASMHLTSVMLDTLLCILVDAPQGLRIFEELNGLQVIVKLLKRSGSPREIRSVVSGHRWSRLLTLALLLLWRKNEMSRIPLFLPAR